MTYVCMSPDMHASALKYRFLALSYMVGRHIRNLPSKGTACPPSTFWHTLVEWSDSLKFSEKCVKLAELKYWTEVW